jgi:hypothetical protein
VRGVKGSPSTKTHVRAALSHGGPAGVACNDKLMARSNKIELVSSVRPPHDEGPRIPSLAEERERLIANGTIATDAPPH